MQAVEQQPWGTPVTGHDDLIGEVEMPTPGPIDPTDNEAVQSLLSGSSEAPKIAAPGELSYELPGGWIDDSGTLRRTVLVRELTGRDEEAISRINPTRSPSMYINMLVLRGVVSIEGIPFSEQILKRLLTGDREALLLAIRIAAFGPKVQYMITCPGCGQEDEIEVDLEKEIPVKRLENIGDRQFSVKLRRGQEALVRLPDVKVQDIMLAKDKTGPEMVNTTLRHCVLSIDGAPMNDEMVLNLGLADRKTLSEALLENMPGPDWEGVKMPCRQCGRESTLNMDIVALFQGS